MVVLVPAFLDAQAPDSSKTYVLDPIVVTASQIEALRSTVPVAVSVLSRAQLQQSGETSVLRVINEMVPGVFVTERGILGYGVSTGSAGEITIRGVGGNPNTDVLVLTDGRPQMMGLMGHPLPDTYVNSGIDRVEVIRGPASLMHGTNAMGGGHQHHPGTPVRRGLQRQFRKLIRFVRNRQIRRRRRIRV
jgi:outer membrane receptor for ferrienterochelin and colicin